MQAKIENGKTNAGVKCRGAKKGAVKRHKTNRRSLCAQSAHRLRLIKIKSEKGAR